MSFASRRLCGPHGDGMARHAREGASWGLYWCLLSSKRGPSRLQEGPKRAPRGPQGPPITPRNNTSTRLGIVAGWDGGDTRSVENLH
eukprot:9399098-Pyramimonas_sp.AAC.1